MFNTSHNRVTRAFATLDATEFLTATHKHLIHLSQFLSLAHEATYVAEGGSEEDYEVEQHPAYMTVIKHLLALEESLEELRELPVDLNMGADGVSRGA